MQKAFYLFLTVTIISGLLILFAGIAEERSSSIAGSNTFTNAQKIEETKTRFRDVLESHTNWAQMKTWLENSPAPTLALLIASFEAEIASIDARIAELQQRSDDLTELKEELEEL